MAATPIATDATGDYPAENWSAAMPTLEHDKSEKALQRAQKALQIARTAHALKPDWVTFYREILGLRGVIRGLFPAREQLCEFEQTQEYQEIQRLLTALRKRKTVCVDPDDPMEIITIRIPKSMHDALRTEAHEHCTSMNKLCISKLLQFIDTEMVPPDRIERIRKE